MAVKGKIPPSGEDATDASVEDDLRELTRLMGPVFRAMKRRGVASMPELMRQLYEIEDHLGPRHIPVLVTLAREGSMSVSELAKRIGLSVATISLMVGELDRRKLVERREDDNDRRRTMVSVPERHRPAIDAWAAGQTEPLRRALERMDTGTRRCFLAGWQVLAEEVTGDEAGVRPRE